MKRKKIKEHTNRVKSDMLFLFALPWSNSRRGVFKWLAGAHCVEEMKRAWITSYRTVIQFGGYGGHYLYPRFKLGMPSLG